MGARPCGRTTGADLQNRGAASRPKTGGGGPETALATDGFGAPLRTLEATTRRPPLRPAGDKTAPSGSGGGAVRYAVHGWTGGVCGAARCHARGTRIRRRWWIATLLRHAHAWGLARPGLRTTRGPGVGGHGWTKRTRPDRSERSGFRSREGDCASWFVRHLAFLLSVHGMTVL